MSNWTVVVNKPEFLEKTETLVPKEKIVDLLISILKDNNWSSNASITIKPTEMGYFDGRP